MVIVAVLVKSLLAVPRPDVAILDRRTFTEIGSSVNAAPPPSTADVCALLSVVVSHATGSPLSANTNRLLGRRFSIVTVIISENTATSCARFSRYRHYADHNLDCSRPWPNSSTVVVMITTRYSIELGLVIFSDWLWRVCARTSVRKKLVSGSDQKSYYYFEWRDTEQAIIIFLWQINESGSVLYGIVQVCRYQHCTEWHTLALTRYL